MLTPNDIRNPGRKSGYSYVQQDDRTKAKPFQAFQYVPGGGPTRPRWVGPARASATEAAQDYCDRVNGTPRKPRNIGSITVSLASAGHRARKVARGAIRRKQRGDGRQAAKLGYVYLIGEEGLPTFVKVGYSKDATLRIGSLQTGNPRKLVILGVIRGTEADERELHAEFIDQNVLGEWFRPTPALLSEFDVEPEMIA